MSQFFLLYNQYGGSGVNISYGDLQEMNITEIFHFLELLRDAREREAAELSKIKR